MNTQYKAKHSKSFIEQTLMVAKILSAQETVRAVEVLLKYTM